MCTQIKRHIRAHTHKHTSPSYTRIRTGGLRLERVCKQKLVKSCVLPFVCAFSGQIFALPTPPLSASSAGRCCSKMSNVIRITICSPEIPCRPPKITINVVVAFAEQFGNQGFEMSVVSCAAKIAKVSETGSQIF